MTIVIGNEFQVWTILITKKLSLFVSQELKLYPILELKDSPRMLTLFQRTFIVGSNISTFLLRFRGFIHSILSLLLITLYISIKSPLSCLSFKVSRPSLFNLSSYSSFPIPVGILVAFLWTLSSLSMFAFRCRFHAFKAYS